MINCKQQNNYFAYLMTNLGKSDAFYEHQMQLYLMNVLLTSQCYSFGSVSVSCYGDSVGSNHNSYNKLIAIYIEIKLKITLKYRNCVIHFITIPLSPLLPDIHSQFNNNIICVVLHNLL